MRGHLSVWLSRCAVRAPGRRPIAVRAQRPPTDGPAAPRCGVRSAGCSALRRLPGSAQALDFTGSCSAPTTTTCTRIGPASRLPDPLRKSGWFGGLESGLNYIRHTPPLSASALTLGSALTRYADEPLFRIYRAAAQL